MPSESVIRRAIKAAQSSGAGTVRLRPDGVIEIDTRQSPNEVTKADDWFGKRAAQNKIGSRSTPGKI